MKKAAMKEEVRSLQGAGVYICKKEEGYHIWLNGWYVNDKEKPFESAMDIWYNQGKNRFELFIKEHHLRNSKELHKYKRLFEKAEDIVNRLNKLVERHKSRFDECLDTYKPLGEENENK